MNNKDDKGNTWYNWRFIIEIQRLNILWKLSSSKKISLKSKLEEAKDILQKIYEEYPEIDPHHENILKNSLIESFNSILSLAIEK